MVGKLPQRVVEPGQRHFKPDAQRLGVGTDFPSAPAEVRHQRARLDQEGVKIADKLFQVVAAGDLADVPDAAVDVVDGLIEFPDVGFGEHVLEIPDRSLQIHADRVDALERLAQFALIEEAADIVERLVKLVGQLDEVDLLQFVKHPADVLDRVADVRRTRRNVDNSGRRREIRMRQRRRQRIVQRKFKITSPHQTGRVEKTGQILLLHYVRQRDQIPLTGIAALPLHGRRKDVEIDRDGAVLLAHRHRGNLADRHAEILDRRPDRQTFHRSAEDGHRTIFRREKFRDADRDEADHQKRDRDQQERPEFQAICFIHSRFPPFTGRRC